MRSLRGHVMVVVVALVLAGCASYQLPPLTADHPAHPAAPAVPDLPRSRTLAYAPSDVPATQPVTSVAGAHEGRGSQPSGQAATAQASAPQTVEGEGQVIATTPRSSQIVVDHEEIKGFMEAMTMGYRTDPPTLLEGLQPGDRIRFTIDVQQRAIVKIEKLK